MTNSDRHGPGRRAGLRVLQAATLGALGMTTLLSCATSEPATPIDAAGYRAALAAVCDASAAELGVLVEPTGAAEVSPFATEVARLLDAEADAARAVRAPDELDADHRAFVQNTADQASAWERLAAIDDGDAAGFAELRTEILQLSLGRDDLASEMGVDACRRTAR